MLSIASCWGGSDSIQADCEIGGPHLYVKDILPSAPTKVDQLMVARTAAEEMDHFRKIGRVAGDMGIDVSFVLTWPNQKRYLDAFRGIIKTWEDFAIFGFLIDRVSGRFTNWKNFSAEAPYWQALTRVSSP